jgi:hypothetical protein
MIEPMIEPMVERAVDLLINSIFLNPANEGGSVTCFKYGRSPVAGISGACNPDNSFSQVEPVITVL